MIDPGEVVGRLQAALPGSRVSIRDLTGGSDHYEVVVEWERFAGKTLIEQHRIVYAPLKDLLGGELHALSVRTLTPIQGGSSDAPIRDR